MKIVIFEANQTEKIEILEERELCLKWPQPTKSQVGLSNLLIIFHLYIDEKNQALDQVRELSNVTELLGGSSDTKIQAWVSL